MGSFHPSAGQHSEDQLKVVFIQTQYINTDPRSFKSVVQSLTGKDSSCHLSCLNEEHLISPPSSLATKLVAADDFSWPSYTTEDYFSLDHGYSMLDKQSSIRDLERLISQLPPVEDLYRFWDNL